MNSRKKGNLLVFSIIAIIALIFSSSLAAVTTGLFPSLETDPESNKLYAIDDGNFTASFINSVEIQGNITNTTNNTNNTNNTNYTQYFEYF